MEIRNIKLSELQAFVDSDLVKKSSAVPITDLRVISQLNNPDAQPEDIVLSVAWGNKTLLGYIGALPTNFRSVHCAWNSCWWVSSLAPQGLSMQLLYQFVSNWDKKVLFSEMTPHTSEIIKLMDFCKHETIWGIRCFYRFRLQHYLLRKYKNLTVLSPFLKMGDRIFNLGLDLIRKNKHLIHENVQVSKLQYPDEEGLRFIRKNAGITDRDNSSVFKWISIYPWITTNKSESIVQRDAQYYFSYLTKRFSSYWLKFNIADVTVGVAMVTIRDFELKIPYVYFDDSQIGLLAEEVLKLLKSDKKIVSVTAFHPELVKYLQKHTRGFLHKRPVPKFTAVSRDVLNELNISYTDFQMGDGDVVFT